MFNKKIQVQVAGLHRIFLTLSALRFCDLLQSTDDSSSFLAWSYKVFVTPLWNLSV